jgi:hypothetical protein
VEKTVGTETVEVRQEAKARLLLERTQQLVLWKNSSSVDTAESLDGYALLRKQGLEEVHGKFHNYSLKVQK